LLDHRRRRVRVAAAAAARDRYQAREAQPGHAAMLHATARALLGPAHAKAGVVGRAAAFDGVDGDALDAGGLGDALERAALIGPVPVEAQELGHAAVDDVASLIVDDASGELAAVARIGGPQALSALDHELRREEADEHLVDRAQVVLDRLPSP